MKKLFLIIVLCTLGIGAFAQEPDTALYKEIVTVQSENQVKLSLEQLASYVGDYELKEGFSIKFYIKGGDFMSQATGQDAHFMIAQGNHKFIPADFPSVATFVANEEGVFDKLIITQSGRDFEFNRVD
ncbi:hypothetical protein EAX61_15040 [Dokdonia sinensis]|uniref:DUF3471 domain-containing protein n=1 Tax=Dokdonia sinensis TaxID=2479847 RepID=A0A3M0G262_9FLAO|nr:hypothetical protein [Dokdonia sinensis]RMB56272.1 hypothetical protein EAX61_15040 [Dokdonia sinensis]